MSAINTAIISYNSLLLVLLALRYCWYCCLSQYPANAPANTPSSSATTLAHAASISSQPPDLRSGFALQDHRLEVEVYIHLCKGLSCTTTSTCPPLPVKVLLSTQKQKQVPYYFYLIPQQQGLTLPSTRTVPRNPLEHIQRISFLVPTHAFTAKASGYPPCVLSCM